MKLIAQKLSEAAGNSLDLEKIQKTKLYTLIMDTFRSTFTKDQIRLIYEKFCEISKSHPEQYKQNNLAIVNEIISKLKTENGVARDYSHYDSIGYVP